MADWVVDVGPGAGEHGGEVVVSGTVDELLAGERSVTGAYLSGKRSIPLPATRRPARDVSSSSGEPVRTTSREWMSPSR